MFDVGTQIPRAWSTAQWHLVSRNNDYSFEQRGDMSYVYAGLATVSVLALYRGQPPVERTTLECPVRVSHAGPGRARIELQRYLWRPKEANALRVILPDGQLVQGAIIDACNEVTGGWLLIDVTPHELVPEQPPTPTAGNAVSMNDTLSELSLPAALRTQASALLDIINGASNRDELLRAVGRAEGFVLGLETLDARNAIDVQNLYVVVEAAAHRRQAELGA
ncbi:hypothetical protein ACOI9X_24425 [Pseudomonas sp. P2757]|uniref:hypothetical protein n=1 Tax=Pseudomonas sp. P2757 TaxID=3409917 RepID=UPI003B5C2E14